MRRPIALLALLAVPAAFAQRGVELVLEDTEAFRGEPLTAQVIVHDFKECEQPQFPEIDGCVVRVLPGASDQVSQSWVNGQFTQSKTRTYSFELIPAKLGNLTIPPVKVVVDGKNLATRIRTVRVKESDSEKLLSAEIVADHKHTYVGQQVSITMTIWVRAVKAGQYLLSGREMFELFERTDWGPFPMPDRVNEETRPTPDEGSGKFYAYQTTAVVTPSRAGPISLDDVEITIRYPTQFGRGIFGDLSIRAYRRIRTRPKLPSLEVMPLPTANRPVNFSGAIGRFEMNVRAEPTNVRVGDPIKLTIDITGDGPIAGLGPPLLSADPKLNDGFRVPREELAGETKGLMKRFTQVIRAKRAGLTEIPAIEYPYFDPERGEYIVARSESIPITVAAGENLGAADLTSIETPVPGSEHRNEPLDGLRGIQTSENLLLSSYAPVQMWEVMGVTVLPALAFFALWGQMAYAQARRNDSTSRRRSAAFSRARDRISQSRSRTGAELAHEIRSAMSGYLSDRLNEPPARFDGLAAVQFLRERPVPEPLIAQWSDVIERCDRASFAGSADGDPAKLADDARECLSALERQRI